MIFFFFGGIIKKKGKEKNPSWLGSSNTADCQFCLMMEHKWMLISKRIKPKTGGIFFKRLELNTWKILIKVKH